MYLCITGEAKPGDLIFFQGTYNTSGASHVGIYVGNNMMIHCGDPIHYSNISTPTGSNTSCALEDCHKGVNEGR